MKLKINRMNKLIMIVLPLLFLFACGDKNGSAGGEQKEAKHFLLPLFGEKKLTDTKGTDTIYHTIGSFKLLDQYKDTITEQTVNNKIYVADFFFATCQSICPQMSTQLIRVQDEFKADPDFLILSHTVNPAHDTAEVLNMYAGKYKAIKGKWHFLTGSKKAIYSLAK